MSVTDYLAIALVVIIQATGMVVLFMMFTRRGWWKDPDIGIDWTTTDGCRACWEYGPYSMTDSWTIASKERARDVHQAQHQLIEPFARQLVRLVDWLARVIPGSQTRHPL